MAAVTQQQLEDAALDAGTISKFVNDAPDAANAGHAAGTVTNREGATFDNLRKSQAAIAASTTEAEGFRDEASGFKDAAELAAAAAAASAADADIGAERGVRLAQAFRAAFKDAARPKFLLSADGAKTYKPDSDTEINSIVPLLAPAGVTVGQSAITWNGTGGGGVARPLRPVATSAGLSMHRQTGFTVNGVILTQLLNFAIDFVIQTEAVVAPYASVAAMNAANTAAPFRVGDIMRVTGGPNTIYTPDIPDVVIATLEYQAGEAVKGLYLKGNTTLEKFANTKVFYFVDTAASPGTNYLAIVLDNRGQVQVIGYDGTNQVSLRSNALSVYDLATVGPVQCRVESDGYQWMLWLGGRQIAAQKSALNFTPNKLYINGIQDAPAGYEAIPVNGNTFTLGALSISENATFGERRQASDAIAKVYGTPIQRFSPILDLFLNTDQSRSSLSPGLTTGDANRPDSISNWTGEVRRAVATDYSDAAPSQEWLPGLYSSNGPTKSDDIGPFSVNGNIYGNMNGGTGVYTQSGSGTETIELGFAKQWFLSPMATNDLCIIGVTYGGYPESYMVQKSTTPRYLFDLLDGSAAGPQEGMQTREQTTRAVMEVVKWARRRGQTVRLVGVSKLNGETLAPLPAGYTASQFGAAIEDDFRSWWTNELSKVVDHTSQPPAMLKKAISYSANGADNSYNTAAYQYVDDQFRRREANRDGVFRYVFLGSTAIWLSRFIHFPAVLNRKFGEVMGDACRRAYLDHTDVLCLQVKTVARSGANIVVTFNRPIATVDTVAPQVLGRLKTGGFDTWGLVFEPHSSSPGRTISGNVTIAGDGLSATIPISGGGPLAGNLDRVGVEGVGAMYNNLRAATRRYGQYRDQNWGAMPFATATPAPDYTGGYNELTEHVTPGSYTVP